MFWQFCGQHLELAEHKQICSFCNIEHSINPFTNKLKLIQID